MNMDYSSNESNDYDEAISLFPPLEQYDTHGTEVPGLISGSPMEEMETITTQQDLHNPAKNVSQTPYLWDNVEALAIPGSSHLGQHKPIYSPGHQELDCSPKEKLAIPTQSDCSSSEMRSPSTAENTAAFNISWGGNDKPPPELLDNEHDSDTMTRPRKPLPKPRGIRKLPEPEPAEDGTLDENTIRRRKNTFAARRSRLKKFLRIEQLENKVNMLQTENAKLVLSNALLESEKRSWIAKEAEYKRRIQHLEGLPAEQSPVTQPSPVHSLHGAIPAPSQSPSSMDGWIVSN